MAAGNEIGDAGCRAVAEALKTNSTLSSLDLTCECVVCGLAMIVGGGCAQGGRQRVAGRGRRSNCGLDGDWWRRWAAGCGCAGEAGVVGRRDVAGEVGWCGVCGGACVGCGGVCRALLAWLSEHGRWRHAMAGLGGGLSLWCLC